MNAPSLLPLFAGCRKLSAVGLSMLVFTSTAGAETAKPTFVSPSKAGASESRIQVAHPDEFQSPRARIAAHLTSPDRSFLNRYTLPLVGKSQRVRANAAHAAARHARMTCEVQEIVTSTTLTESSRARTLQAQLYSAARPVEFRR